MGKSSHKSKRQTPKSKKKSAKKSKNRNVSPKHQTKITFKPDRKEKMSPKIDVDRSAKKDKSKIKSSKNEVKDPPKPVKEPPKPLFDAPQMSLAELKAERKKKMAAAKSQPKSETVKEIMSMSPVKTGLNNRVLSALAEAGDSNRNYDSNKAEFEPEIPINAKLKPKKKINKDVLNNNVKASNAIKPHEENARSCAYGRKDRNCVKLKSKSFKKNSMLQFQILGFQ